MPCSFIHISYILITHIVRRPTIRYFNKKTGAQGAGYTKRTDDAMCTELLNFDYMADYIETAGDTFLCNVDNGENCDDRELAYIEKMKKDADKATTQLHRLSNMDNADMSEDNRMWAFKRKRILERLVGGGKEAQEL